MTYPDRVTVLHKIATPIEGASDSWALDVLIISERFRRITARCHESLVLYDYTTASKVSLGGKPFILQAFEDTLRAQREESERCLQFRRRITQALRRLEVSSWDRSDAKEDFGSAA